MARKKTHAPSNSRERVPAGHVKALCGQIVPRRETRRSGVNCSLCAAVAANTVASDAAIRATVQAGQLAKKRGGR